MDKRSKVVITGATGMVGTHLVLHLLAEGYTDISVLVRSPQTLGKLLDTLSETHKKAIHPLYVSLFDIALLKEAFANTKLLFHCAAIVDLDNNKPQQLIEDNVRMTHCVAEAALQAGVERMVHLSSIATLTPPSYPAKTTENATMTTLSGRSPYSISKFYCEGEVWRAAQKGLKIVVVNPAVILGTGNWNKGTAQFFAIIDKCPYFYTNGIMGYVSATDVARMCLALSQQEAAVGERFILCSNNLSFKELIGYIRQSLDKKGAFMRISDTLIKAIIVFTHRKVLDNLIEKECYDGTKAEQVAGIRYTSLKEEIYKIGEAYNNEHYKKGS